MDRHLSDMEQGGKYVYIETFGCQMNDNDSDRMLAVLKDADCRQTDSPEKADIIIVNTCSIRDKAEKKVYSTIGRYKALKKQKPSLVISVAGCVAQQEGEKLLKRAPYLDLVVGPHNIHRLSELVREVSTNNSRVVATELNESIDPDEYGYVNVPDGIKAFVSIMRGCNNFCAYCIVPYTRGREVSRTSADIAAEVERLAQTGVKEVTLLGQNVNSYGTSGGGDVSFPELLSKVAGVPGIERVRFVTSHPKDISLELIDLFGKEPKLCRSIHLPVQSGSDSVLAAMGRGYTGAEYLDKVMRIKRLYPEMSVTTDIIVGFPGETEDDFEATLRLLDTVRFDNIFSFMYSPRPGTRAAGYDGQVPLEVRSGRLSVLQEKQKGITIENSKLLVGRTLTVLVEGTSKASEEEMSGRTTCNRIVNFPGPPELAGSLVDVVITAAYTNSLRGSLNERGVLCS